MVKRKRLKARSRKAAHRKPTRRKAVRKKATKRKRSTTPLQAVAKNRRAQWIVFRDLQKKADKAWAKLRLDVKRKASPEILLQDRNNLLFLLGECNYLAEEYMRMDTVA